MDPTLLGVELPPVPAPAGGGAPGAPPLGPWFEAARAAAGAGSATVWFSGGPGGLGRAEEPPGTCDACTVAAAAATSVPGVHLGVVSLLPVGRHPAVLARDLTTLDVVAGGRAAGLLRWSSEPWGADPDSWERLFEAVVVCRSVLSEDDPVFEGRFFHVAGARNAPPPPQGRGLPLMVQVPTGIAPLTWRSGGAASLARLGFAASSAFVCPDEPAELAAWRATIDDVAVFVEEEAPALVCRTTLAPRPEATGARLAAAREAGADGVLVRLPAGRRGDSPFAHGTGAGDLEAALAAAFSAFGPIGPKAV